MRCITLTQPYATLIAIGAKKIETRSWSTSHRGLLAIHAAQGLGPVGGKRGYKRLCFTEPFLSVLSLARQNRSDTFYLVDYFMSLPRGAIVATCTLIDCVPTHNPAVVNEPGKPWFTGARKGVGQHYYEVPPPKDSNEYAFGDYTPGRYAWLLADVRALPEPIPAKGALGLWNYEGEP